MHNTGASVLIVRSSFQVGGDLIIILPLSFHTAATFSSFECQLLTSSIPDDNLVCPGEPVTFTCVTKGSSTIAWRSEEYIEVGGTQLQFAVFNNVGDTRTSIVNPNTVATLINKTNEGVLVSELRIIVQSNIPMSTVTCVTDSGAMNITSFQLTGMKSV